MLAGVSGYSKGVLVTGTIPSKGATTYTPGTTNQTIASGQYLSGTQTIAGDADLKAENIKSGVNLFGVNGTFTSDATATAADVLTGKTAYVNGSKITGTHTAQNHTYGVAAEIAKTFGSSTECEASVSLSHTIGVGTYIVFAGVSKTDGTNHDAYLDFFSPMVNVTRSIAAGEYIMRATSKIWSFYSYI